MKDVRPKIKHLIKDFPLPPLDPHRVCVNLPRGEAPDIPFCHYTPIKTLFFKGNKFEILKFELWHNEIDTILRITIDGIMYHLATCPQWDGEMVYCFYFCKCNDLPNEMQLQYDVEKKHEIFDVSVTGIVRIHHVYRSDHQKHLETTDSEVREFFQNILNLCRDFYLANKTELDRML